MDAQDANQVERDAKRRMKATRTELVHVDVTDVQINENVLVRVHALDFRRPTLLMKTTYAFTFGRFVLFRVLESIYFEAHH